MIIVDIDMCCYFLYVVIENFGYDVNIGLVVCIVNVFVVYIVYIVGCWWWNWCGVVVIDCY